MTFKLPSQEDKAEYVHRQFERIAKRYDLTNDVISLGMHRGWKSRAVDELKTRSDGSYLDVCCGTGDLALTIAARLGDRGKVTGVDFSQNMLDVAAQRALKAQRQGKTNCEVQWRQGDAQDLPFAENSFDGAIISFGLRNLTDYKQGIYQMSRVVRPGGKVINLDLGHPSLPVFTQVFGIYFRHVVPIIGAILQNDRQAYTYLPESLSTYPNHERLTSIFEEVGLKDVQWTPLSMGSVSMHVGTVA
jgi:demethylmenaquinone methyltransferase / 2-methoxy-6-polyprenyl-1,4-benzoquinol methylase